MWSGYSSRGLLAGALLIGTTACASGSSVSTEVPAPENASVATSLVIDQFLRAANSNDLDTMARLFGTSNGSILNWEKKEDVDKRMFTIASVLRHDSYTVKRQEIVPGRRDEATRVIVGMKIGRAEIEVPYTLVWTKDRIWLIEQIGIDQITNRE
jgi:hypothetical protein